MLYEVITEPIDAKGLLLTPGFVDVHTHYDGQATWDEMLAPSCWHGVTTISLPLRQTNPLMPVISTLPSSLKEGRNNFV